MESQIEFVDVLISELYGYSSNLLSRIGCDDRMRRWNTNSVIQPLSLEMSRDDLQDDSDAKQILKSYASHHNRAMIPSQRAVGVEQNASKVCDAGLIIHIPAPSFCHCGSKKGLSRAVTENITIQIECIPGSARSEQDCWICENGHRFSAEE